MEQTRLHLSGAGHKMGWKFTSSNIKPSKQPCLLRGVDVQKPSKNEYLQTLNNIIQLSCLTFYSWT